MAMLNIIGQCGPLVGTRLYPDTDKPYYVRGMSICALFMLAVAGLAFLLRIVLKRANGWTRESKNKEGSNREDGVPLVSEGKVKRERKAFYFML